MPQSGSSEAEAVSNSPAWPLTPIEREIVGLFIHLTRVVGLPRSAAEIYGSLFISPEPLSYEEIASRLNLSSGSASHGLRLLRTIGAVNTVYVPGDRRDHYIAAAGIQVTAGFLRSHLMEQIANGEQHLARVAALLGRDEEEERRALFLAERISVLKQWLDETKRLIPGTLMETNGAATQG